MKSAITDIPISEFPALVKELGMPKYAAQQLIAWIYQKRVDSFDQMSNLSQAAREQLSERYVLDNLELSATQISLDGTKKFLLRCHDGKEIECVLIPAASGRRTVCVSSQVGCALACDFCRTGKMGLSRHLTQGEIVSQLRFAMRESDLSVSNVVFMGMGEPMHNLDNVVNAANLMCNPQAFGLSKRKITVSTSGLLDKLAEFITRCDVKIAFSLSATTDAQRDILMPINKRYPLAKIMEFFRDYTKTTNNRITFEYIMIKGVNDSTEDAKRLVKLVQGVSCKINLIPMNAYQEAGYYPSKNEHINWWCDYLESKGVCATVRISRGQDILAACGQLARGELKI